MNSSTIDEIHNPPTKSRRGRKRVTDPILANELKRHRRSRANDRERTRMRLLNEALEHLRTLLPIDSSPYYSPADSLQHGVSVEDKLTKIETLRTASAYIRLLTDLLDNDAKTASTSNFFPYNLLDHHQQQQQQQHEQQQQQQVCQHSSYFPYTSSYSYYHHPYC